MLYIVASLIIVAITIRILRKLTLPKCKCATRLDGKTVLLVGGNSGIGKATAVEIAKRGARLIIASRNLERSKQTRDEIIATTYNNNIEARQLDLESFANIREFAKEFVATEVRLDILINNAGSINRGGGEEITVDGNEVNMQVNHLGQFLLMNLLLDLLKSSAPSRIVVVSTEGHKGANSLLNPIDLNELPKFRPKIISGFILYFIANLCKMLVVKEMARRLQGTGVTINALNPGPVKTDIVEGVGKLLRIFVRIFILWPFLITPFEACQNTLHVALSKDLEGVSGKYFDHCKVAKKSRMADDEQVAKTVWETSLKMVGEK